MWANLNLKSLQDKFQESLHDLESSLAAVAPPAVPPPGQSGSSQPSSPSTRRQQPPPVTTRQSPSRTNSGGGIALPLSPTSLSNAQQSASQLADSALSSLRASLRKGRQSFDAARASLDGGVTSPTARRTTSMDSVRSQTDSIREREMEDRGKGKGKLEELQEHEEGESAKVGKSASDLAPVPSAPAPVSADVPTSTQPDATDDDQEDEDAWGVGGGDEDENAQSDEPEAVSESAPPTTDILLDLSDPVEEPPADTKPQTATADTLEPAAAPSVDDDAARTALQEPLADGQTLPADGTPTLPPSSPPKPLVNPVLASLQQESASAEQDLTADTPRPSTMGIDLPEANDAEFEPLAPQEAVKGEEEEEDDEDADGWDLPEVEEEPQDAEEEKSTDSSNAVVEGVEVKDDEKVDEKVDEVKPVEEEAEAKPLAKSFLDPLSEPFTPTATPPVELSLASPSSIVDEIEKTAEGDMAEDVGLNDTTPTIPPITDADEVGPAEYPEDIEDLADSQGHSVPSTSETEPEPVPASIRDDALDAGAADAEEPSVDDVAPSSAPEVELDAEPLSEPVKREEAIALDGLSDAQSDHVDHITNSLDQGIELVEEQVPASPLVDISASEVAAPETNDEAKEGVDEEARIEPSIELDSLIVEPVQPTVEIPETNPHRERLILDEAETVQEPLAIEPEEAEAKVEDDANESGKEAERDVETEKALDEKTEEEEETKANKMEEQPKEEATEATEEETGPQEDAASPPSLEDATKPTRDPSVLGAGAGDVEPELIIEPESQEVAAAEGNAMPVSDALPEKTEVEQEASDSLGSQVAEEQDQDDSKPTSVPTTESLVAINDEQAPELPKDPEQEETSAPQKTAVEEDSKSVNVPAEAVAGEVATAIEEEDASAPAVPEKDEHTPSRDEAASSPLADQVESVASEAEPVALAPEKKSRELVEERQEAPAETVAPSAPESSAVEESEEPTVEVSRERSMSISQDPRFTDLAASHEKLKGLKASLDSLVTELMPSISSVDDTEVFGAELRNLKVKADMGMEEVRRMSGQLDQQKSRIEELRETHRLEHQSQQTEIDALRDSLSARNKSLEEANDKLAAADKSAEATRQEIVKAADEYDKLKLVAKEEEEKRVKALSLLRALRQKLVKNEQEKGANDQELEKARKAEKDALDTLKSDRARFDKEIVALRTAHEAQITKLRTGFEREAQGLKERFEKEAVSKRGQFELDAIHVKATQAKELAAKDARIAQLEAAVKDLTKSRDQVFEDAQRKTEEIETTKAEEATLRGRTTELEYELSEARDKIAALADELDEVKRAKSETNRDDSSARKILAETEARYEGRVRELEARARQLEKDRREVEDEMGRNMQDRLREVERMRVTLAQKDLDYAESVQNSQKRDAQIAEGEKAKADLEKRLKNFEEMLKSVKADADKAINAEVAVREELGDRVQRAAELEARLEEVQAKESTLRSNNKTLREELRKLQSGVLLSEKQRHPGVGYFSSFNTSSTANGNGHPGSPEAAAPSNAGQVISPSASVSSLASAATGVLGGTARANGSADEALNFEYLRNVILQFLEKPEMRPHLISVLGVILHFTPAESRRLVAKAGH